MNASRIPVRKALMEQALSALSVLKDTHDLRLENTHRYPVNELVPKLAWAETYRMTVKFFHLTLVGRLRPVLIGENRSAVEFLFVHEGKAETQVGLCFLMAEDGRVVTHPEGGGLTLGSNNEWKTTDTICAWLSDRIEHVGLLAPTPVPTGLREAV